MDAAGNDETGRDSVFGDRSAFTRCEHSPALRLWSQGFMSGDELFRMSQARKLRESDQEGQREGGEISRSG